MEQRVSVPDVNLEAVLGQVPHEPALLPGAQESGVHHVLQLQARWSCQTRSIVMEMELLTAQGPSSAPEKSACSHIHSPPLNEPVGQLVRSKVPQDWHPPTETLGLHGPPSHFH